MTDRQRAAHFAVERVHIDGRTDGTFTVEPVAREGTGYLAVFRPTRGREYALPLAVVCEMIAWRAAKNEAWKKGKGGG